jgi:Flp pilus assembly protein TadG
MIRNRHGAALAIVAISLVVILGMGALAVDMGMLIKQRDDAQRAADAAALAGASAFQDEKALDAVPIATTRAIDYLGKNYVGGTYIDTTETGSYVNDGNRYVTEVNEGVVVVLPDSQKVRVIVRRQAVGTLFGRVMGFLNIPIAAKSAARVFEAGTGKCVKPFAFPDFGDDADNDPNGNKLEDLGPGQGKGGEAWKYGSSASDHYRAFGNDDGTGTVTGLGSDFRNNSVAEGDKSNTRYWDDYGRPIILKKSNPQQTSSPGFFLPWVIPGSNPGAQDYKKNIFGCNPAEINLTTDFNIDGTADTSSYDNKPGNMIGPTKQGMDSLIALDPDACWAEMPDTNTSHTGGPFMTGEVMKKGAGGSCDQPYPGWKSSPRVAIVPLFDPAQMHSGKSQLRFNNLALIFIDPQLDRHAPVAGHFLYYVKGTGPADPESGSLIKTLKLVE